MPRHRSSRFVIRNSFNNSAVDKGAGIYDVDAKDEYTMRVEDCVFITNTAGDGAHIYTKGTVELSNQTRRILRGARLLVPMTAWWTTDKSLSRMQR